MEISFIHMQILVHLHVNKTNFHTKGFSLGLALKQRRKVTRKSPIGSPSRKFPLLNTSWPLKNSHPTHLNTATSLLSLVSYFSHRGFMMMTWSFLHLKKKRWMKMNNKKVNRSDIPPLTFLSLFILHLFLLPFVPFLIYSSFSTCFLPYPQP